MKRLEFDGKEHVDPSYFYILTDDMHDELTRAHRDYLEATRPHQHPLLAVERPLMEARKEALLTEIRLFASDEEIMEIERYSRAVMAAKTSRESKTIPRPDLLGGEPPRKQLDPDEREHRKKIVKWIYLVVCEEVSRGGDPSAFKRFRALSWTNWDHIDVGIEYKAICPSCHAEGMVHLLNLESPAALSFECEHCQHRYNLFDSRELLDETPCECMLCQGRSRTLVKKIRRLLGESQVAILGRYHRWQSTVSANTKSWPTQMDMFRHYELNKDNLTKDLRAILSLKPTTYSEFEECLSMYAENVQGKSQAIFDAASRMKLIYSKGQSSTQCASSIGDLLHNSLEVQYEHRGERSWGVGTITKASAEGERIVETLLNDTDISSAIVVRNDSIWINLSSEKIVSAPATEYALLFRPSGLQGFSGGLLAGAVKPDYAVEYKLNPNFVQGATKSAPLAFEPNSNQPNLFKSPPEGNGALRLVAEFVDHWIVPNRLMRQIVDLNAIKQHFEPKAMTYLWTCEVDFTVYNAEGVVVLVEELQRGRHHNDKEWIWKDSIKRRALEFSRVSFRESF